MDDNKRLILSIDKLWDGSTADKSEWAEVAMAMTPAGVTVDVTARYHGDPAPELPPGQTDGLWNYEVVELFVANENGEYLELELGPHGHYLALLFSGARDLARRDLDVICQAAIAGSMWTATAHVPRSCLPSGISRANAYAIHGTEESRRFLAASPVPGARPDFHQPRLFKLLREIPRGYTARFLK